jgi:hypothetical protein
VNLMAAKQQVKALPKKFVEGAQSLSGRLFGRAWSAWSSLSKLGNSPLAKATIVVPVLGYLLIMNEEFRDWFATGHCVSCPAAEVHEALDQPVPLIYTHVWRLIFIYFGLTLTGIATAIFGLFCPFSSRKYGDGIDYALNVLPLFASREQWESLAETLSGRPANRRHFLAWFCSKDLQDDLKTRVDVISGFARTTPDNATIMSLLRTSYRFVDFEKPFRRLAIFLLYFTGLLLVAASALWGAAEVTAMLLGKELPPSPFCWL